jgi:hypothetical protein
MSNFFNGNRAVGDSIRFTVGRDDDGRWVVVDRDGLVGGLFRDRAAAVHFAMFESSHEPGAVCCVPDGVIGRTPWPAPGKVPALASKEFAGSQFGRSRAGGQ